MNWRDDITAANHAVCESLSKAADELDKRIPRGPRCTCRGYGVCLYCLITEVNRKYGKQAA